MIKITINSIEKDREKCECGVDAVHMQSCCDVEIVGEQAEITHELVSMLESFDKHELLHKVWHDALSLYVEEFQNNLNQRGAKSNEH